jgi:mono/diheme cytochrome c family protein
MGNVPAAGVLAVSQTWRTFGIFLVTILVIGFAVYIWFNLRSAHDEVGAEVELAANRATPPADEELEGKRLELVQFFGVLFLLLIGVGLPYYWLREPGRQAGATEGADEIAVHRGERLFLEGFQCSNCHGPDGGGGAVRYILPIPLYNEDGTRQTDDEGQAINYNVAVNWTAPDLTSVLARFSEDEVRDIITYGRPNSPMPAWGVAGGGVGTTQQVDNVLAYLESIQRSPDDIKAANSEALDKARESGGDGFDEGFWLFEQNCARCHTQGWPWAQNLNAESYAEIEAQLPEGAEVPIGPMGGGRFGPRLDEAGLARQFLAPEDQIDFVTSGSDNYVAYGTGGLGSGKMPGFGNMLEEDQIAAIVGYERQLDPDNDPVIIPGQDEAASAASSDEEGDG